MFFPLSKQQGSVCCGGGSLVDSKLTDGAGFPPFAVQTRVKFWAWYRLNGAGVFSATTDMLFGGAVEDRKTFMKQYPKTLQTQNATTGVLDSLFLNIHSSWGLCAAILQIKLTKTNLRTCFTYLQFLLILLRKAKTCRANNMFRAPQSSCE